MNALMYNYALQKCFWCEKFLGIFINEFSDICKFYQGYDGVNIYPWSGVNLGQEWSEQRTIVSTSLSWYNGWLAGCQVRWVDPHSSAAS